MLPRLKSTGLLVAALMSYAIPLLPIAPNPLQIVAQTVDSRKTESDNLLRQGNEQLKANQTEVALKTLQQALLLYRSLKDRAGEGQALKSLGNGYANLHNYKKALYFQEQALAIARELKDQNLEARALNNIGWAYNNLGSIIQAIKFYQQSLAVSKSSHNDEIQGITLKNLGWLYLDQEEYIEARKYFKERLEIIKTKNEPTKEMSALNDIGISYRKEGNFAEAINYFQQSLIIAREVNDISYQKGHLMNIGLCYSFLGESKKTIDYFQEGLLLQKKNNDLVGQVYFISAIAREYHKTDNFLEAINYYNQALTVNKEVKDVEQEGLILTALTTLYMYLGEESKGLDYGEQYLSLAKRLNNQQLITSALTNLGYAHYFWGSFDKAMNYFKDSLVLAKQIKDYDRWAENLEAIGSTYLQLANLKISKILKDPSAFRKDGKFDDILRKNEDSKLVIALSQKYASTELNQANNYLKQGLLITQRFQKLSPKKPVNELNILIALSAVSSRLGNSKSIDYLMQALETTQKDLSFVRDQKGRVLSQIALNYYYIGEYSKAIDFCRKSLEVLQLEKQTFMEGFTWFQLGMALHQSSQYQEAERALYKSIEVFESIRAGLISKDDLEVSIFERQQSAYRDLEEVLIAQKKYETALEISERGRARTFVKLLEKRESV